MRAAWLLLAGLASISCSDNAPPPPLDAAVEAGCVATPQVGDFPCDVAAVLAAKCQVCHQQPPINHAPFSLLTYADTQAQFGTTSLLKWQRMSQVIEPDGLPHMPPSDHPQLSTDDFAVLRGWFARCAPPKMGSAACPNPDGG